MATTRYNWDKWRTLFVQGDCTLAELSRMEGAPSAIGLRKKSSEEDWPRQRLEFQMQISGQVSEKLREEFAFNVAEMLVQHNHLAQQLLDAAARGLEAMVATNQAPGWRDIVALAKLGVDVQRLIAGQATEIKAGSEAPPSVIILPAKGGE